MGPIALLVLLWLLPMVAAALFFCALVLFLGAKLLLSVPPAFWALTALSATAGSLAGLRIGRRLADSRP